MTNSIHKLHGKTALIMRAQEHNFDLISVVRELIQNSVDSEATRIEIMLDRISLDVIIVDNGHGMKYDDMHQIGSPNTTSKLQTINDLYHIKTYGFRGSSIAYLKTLSKVHIVSKQRDSVAWNRNLNSGTVRVISDSEQNDILPPKITHALHGWPLQTNGTMVHIHHFLYNLPVRRNIVLSESYNKQLKKIRDLIFDTLIVFPKIHITITYMEAEQIISYVDLPCGVKPVLGPSIDQLFGQTLKKVYDLDTSTLYLKYIHSSYQNLEIHGVISDKPPGLRSVQKIYFNNRRLESSKIKRSIDNFCAKVNADSTDSQIGYPKTKYKSFDFFYVLMIRGPQEPSDLLQRPDKVIVHPSNHESLNTLIIKTIESYFVSQSNREMRYDTNKQESGQLPRITEFDGYKEIHGLNRKIRRISQGLSTSPYLVSKNVSVPYKTSQRNRVASKCTYGNMLFEQFLSFGDLDSFKFSREVFHRSRVLNQVDNKFIFFVYEPSAQMKTKNDLVLMLADQHACDERLMLEKYLSDFFDSVINNKVTTQQPAISYTMQFNVQEYQLVEAYLQEFAIWGVILETRSKTTDNVVLEVEYLPDILSSKVNSNPAYLKSALINHVRDLESNIKVRFSKVKSFNTLNNARKVSINTIWWKYMNSIPAFILATISSRACRSAVMFGTKLSRLECRDMLQSLSTCVSPFHCAHGRPSIIPLISLKNTNDIPALKDSEQFMGNNWDYTL